MGPLTGYLIDWWSFAHMTGWFIVTALVISKTKLTLWVTVILAALVGVSWEVIELTIVEPALHFHEPWYNRWCTDLIFDTSGGLFGFWVGDFLRRFLQPK